MDLDKQKYLWYAGLTGLMIICVFIIPIAASKLTGRYFSPVDGFGVMVLIVFFLVFYIQIRHGMKKGNLHEHNIEKYSLLWKDTSPSDKGNDRTRAALKVCCIAAPLLLCVFFSSKFWFNLLPMSLSIGIMVFSLMLGLGSVFFGILSYFSLRTPDLTLHLYKEGFMQGNYFITWAELKSVSWPVSFKAADAIARLKGEHPGKGDVLKIETSKEFYFALVLDKEGFNRAMENAGKSRLIEQPVIL